VEVGKSDGERSPGRIGKRQILKKNRGLEKRGRRGWGKAKREIIQSEGKKKELKVQTKKSEKKPHEGGEKEDEERVAIAPYG